MYFHPSICTSSVDVALFPNRRDMSAWLQGLASEKVVLLIALGDLHMRIVVISHLKTCYLG